MGCASIEKSFQIKLWMNCMKFLLKSIEYTQDWLRLIESTKNPFKIIDDNDKG